MARPISVYLGIRDIFDRAHFLARSVCDELVWQYGIGVRVRDVDCSGPPHILFSSWAYSALSETVYHEQLFRLPRPDIGFLAERENDFVELFDVLAPDVAEPGTLPEDVLCVTALVLAAGVSAGIIIHPTCVLEAMRRSNASRQNCT